MILNLTLNLNYQSHSNLWTNGLHAKTYTMQGINQTVDLAGLMGQLRHWKTGCALQAPFPTYSQWQTRLVVAGS